MGVSSDCSKVKPATKRPSTSQTSAQVELIGKSHEFRIHAQPLERHEDLLALVETTQRLLYHFG